MIKILPSIASADQLNIQKEIDKIKDTDNLHIDVEDGNFLNNITFGMKMIKSIVAYHPFYFDVHLLVTNPLSYLDDLIQLKIPAVSFHIESCEYPFQVLNKLKKNNIKAGVAFNFKTPIDTILPFIESVDYVLIMTSEPDGGDNSFCSTMLEKISYARKTLPSHIEIWVDGGISKDRLKEVVQAGADTVIMGRAIWQSTNPKQTILEFTNQE